MISLDFYCLVPSLLANKSIEIYPDSNCFDKWEDFEEKNRFKKTKDALALPFELHKQKKPLLDVFFVFGGSLIVSSRFKDIFELIISDYFQLLPFGKIKDKDYFLVHAHTSLNCIDYENSIFDSNPSDTATLLTRGNSIYFIKDDVPSNAILFSVLLNDTGIYCTKSFVEMVLDHKITGIGFRDNTIHELTHIFKNTPNPVPEVDNFKLL